ASAFTWSTMTGCGLFPCNIPVGGSVDVAIGATATSEGNLSATLNVFTGASPHPTVALSERGIDRHIAVASMIVFEDTFRFPDANAPPTHVAIQNTGEAPLSISALAIGDAPIWNATTTFAPFDVPGLASTNVDVRFAPIAA